MILQTRHDLLSRRGFLLASASAAMLTACATGSSVPAQSTGPTVASLLAAQAMPIRNLSPDDPGIAALAKRLSTSKITGLGEATHGSHEDALLKSVLIQAMVERHGLRVILLEANRTGCAQLDGYVSGEPTSLMAAEAVKQAPVFRILKTEVVAELLTWLRGWNAVNPDQRVRVIGVDCQASSPDAADALAALARVDSGAAEALRAPLAPILSPEARAAHHSKMLKQLTSAQLAEAEAACRLLETELVRAGLPDAAFFARLAWQGLNAFEYETSDGDLSQASPGYWSRRDVFMAENALTLAQGRPAVFWGHNSHVAGGEPGGEGAGYVPSGAVLRRELGRDYSVLVQDFAKAGFLAIPSVENFEPSAPQSEITRTAQPGTLNALLASVSPRTAWIDLGNLRENALISDWRKTPIGVDWYGAAAAPERQPSDIVQVAPEYLFDILVIHPELTPSRML